jgi:DNA-binding NarL/FixJ family response regulator
MNRLISSKTNFRPEGQEGRSVRALLVDDSEPMRAYLAFLLERESGFEVVGMAADGRQALQAAAELRPDLVLMDVRMPCLDGLEAARLIKKLAAESGYSPKIVMVTSEDTPDCRAEAEDAGADGFVPKSECLRVALKLALEELFLSEPPRAAVERYITS